MTTKIPISFLRTSLRKTRLLRARINDLERELSYFPDKEELQPVTTIPKSEEIPQKILNDYADVVSLFEAHTRYFNELIVEEDQFKQHVPNKFISQYKSLFHELEGLMHRVDPGYIPSS